MSARMPNKGRNGTVDITTQRASLFTVTSYGELVPSIDLDSCGIKNENKIGHLRPKCFNQGERFVTLVIDRLDETL